MWKTMLRSLRAAGFVPHKTISLWKFVRWECWIRLIASHFSRTPQDLFVNVVESNFFA
jgi:hypothetical protein